jgi:eukaryotic-like serine/threonine-protein kinase
MPTVVCHHCSEVFTVDGPKPDQCPSCGRTLHIEGDPTPTGPQYQSTLIQFGERKPTAFGRYVVQSRLGAGGFGSVFLAKDPQLDRLVAIKVPRGETGRSPLGLERFAREGRNIAQLRHPGIVSVFNVELDGELPFIVCEYVEGETLSDHMRKAPLSFREAARLIADVATAVDYAHECGIIHRDIKPSNIMIASDGKPRLMDFGLAKREAIDNTVTSDHAILGTPAYMSPEQAWGRKRGPVDRRSDIYSLGTVLYQLLTRELPFHGEPRMVLRQVIEDDPKSPRSLNADIPRDLETICEKAMQKEPAGRYQTAGALADDLHHWLRGEPIEARPVTRLERSWHWAKRHPAPAALAVSIAALLAVSAGGAFAYAAVANDARKQAVEREHAETNARKTAESSRDKEAELRKLEAEARAREAVARKRAEEALRENRRLLSHAYLEQAAQYQLMGHSVDGLAPLRSLPWLMASLRLDDADPERRETARARLQAQLDFAPKVERLWTHPGGIRSAGLSPKRDLFFTAGVDATVRVWRIADSRPIYSFTLPLPATCAAFNADQTELATGSQDGVRIWDLKSGKLVKGPLSHEVIRGRNGTFRPECSFLRFSHSGHRLFVATHGPSQIWDVETGKPIGQPISSKFPPLSAEFIDGDRSLIAACADGVLRRWDANTGAEVRAVSAMKLLAEGMAVSGDGVTFAAAGPDGVSLRTIDPKAETLVLNHERRSVTALAFSRDGLALATGAKDGTVRLWSVSTGKLLWRRAAFSSQVDALEFSPDKPLVAAVSSYKAVAKGVSFFDLETGDPAAPPVSAPCSIGGWAAGESQFLTADRDGMARLWNIDSREPAFPLPHGNGIVGGLASDDGRVAVAWDGQSTFCILRESAKGGFNASDVTTFGVEQADMGIAALSQDGSKVAFLAEGLVSAVDTASRQRVLGPLDNGASVQLMKFTPDGRNLICLLRDGRVVVWDAAHGQRRYEAIDVGRMPRDLDVDGSGRYFAVAVGREVVLHNVAAGKRVGSPFVHDSNVKNCRFLLNGRFLVTTCREAVARVWDVSSGRLVATTARQESWGAALCCRGNVFLTGTMQGAARLWSAPSGAAVSPTLTHDTAVQQVAISPHGDRVLVTTDDGQVYCWDTKSGELIFVRAMNHLLSHFPNVRDPRRGAHSGVAVVFFSSDGRAAHAISYGGLFFTVDLTSAPRSLAEYEKETAIRSGTRIDAAGGPQLIPGEELATLFQQGKAPR